jgi:hypothetical protein
MYLGAANLAGCPSGNPASSQTNCVESGPEKDGLKKDKGCEKGHKLTLGDTPPDIAQGDVEQTVLDSFTGCYKFMETGPGGVERERKLHIRFYKYRFEFNDNFWIVGLGFEDTDENFQLRNVDETVRDSGVKCFRADIEYDDGVVPFRVLLHRSSEALGAPIGIKP